MKVWVLMDELNEFLVGVFSTEEKALQARYSILRDKARYVSADRLVHWEEEIDPKVT